MKPESTAKKRSELKTDVQATLIMAIREALTIALKDDITDLVVRLALRNSGLDQIPEEGVSLYDFVMGPLRETLQTFVTQDNSEQVITRLLGILVPQISKIDGSFTDISGIRRLSRLPKQGSIPVFENDPSDSLFPDDEPTQKKSIQTFVLEPMVRQTFIPPAIDTTSVFILTKDPRVSMLVAVQLGTDINVESYSDIATFVEMLKSNRSVNSVVLIDFRGPQMPAITLARVTAHLPDEIPIVLWGDNEVLDVQYGVLEQGPSEKWVTCSSDADPEDMSTLIRCAVRRMVP